jgi:hypothetical protein
MPPTHGTTFGGGAAATTLDPIVLIAMVIGAILVLLLPRKYAIVPILFLFFLVPVSQQVVVGGIHLFVSRIIILVGLVKMLWLKLTARTQLLSGSFNSVDRLFLGCVFVQVIAVMLLFLSTDALTNQAGFLLDYLGGYFLLRWLLQDTEDVFRAIKCFAVLVFVVGVCMLGERLTLQNVFGYIGGHFIPTMRNGQARSQGPFDRELMAGVFGATLLPLIFSLWINNKAKALAALGIVGAFLMAWTSNNSTALLALAAGLFAVGVWPLRKSMRVVRWGMVAGIIALQLVMKAPVWFAIDHIDLTGGSSGYQRAELIDQFVRHFGAWWLMGVRSTGAWGWDLWDVQNQFINVGVTGGLIALILFIAMISRCFGRLGSARTAVEGDRKKEWMFWFLGAALFSNIVAFFGVNYFDQTKFAWFALLAMIVAATASVPQEARSLERQPKAALNGRRLAYASPSDSGFLAKGSSRTAQSRFEAGSPHYPKSRYI